ERFRVGAVWAERQGPAGPAGSYARAAEAGSSVNGTSRERSRAGPNGAGAEPDAPLLDQVRPDGHPRAEHAEAEARAEDDQEELLGRGAEAQGQDPEEVDHEAADRVGQEIQPAERDR